jgi:hypothetical protein
MITPVLPCTAINEYEISTVNIDEDYLAFERIFCVFWDSRYPSCIVKGYRVLGEWMYDGGVWI